MPRPEIVRTNYVLSDRGQIVSYFCFVVIMLWKWLTRRRIKTIIPCKLFRRLIILMFWFCVNVSLAFHFVSSVNCFHVLFMFFQQFLSQAGIHACCFFRRVRSIYIRVLFENRLIVIAVIGLKSRFFVLLHLQSCNVMNILSSVWLLIVMHQFC